MSITTRSESTSSIAFARRGYLIASVLALIIAALAVDAQVPLRRELSSTKPLYFYRVKTTAPEVSYRPGVSVCVDPADFPSAMRPYLGMHLAGENISLKPRSLAKARDLSMPVIMGVSPRNNLTTEIEPLLKTYNNLIGLIFVEQYVKNNSFFDSLLVLCAKYGAYWIWGPLSFQVESGLDNQTFTATMMKYHQNVVILRKFNKNGDGNFQRTIFPGSWLSGVGDNWGCNPEFWWWHEYYGQKASVEDCPESLAAQQVLMTILGGGTLYTAFEFFSWEAHQKLVTPLLLKAVGANPLLRSKDEILSATKAVLRADAEFGKSTVLSTLCGGKGFVPANGQCFDIPMVPADVPLATVKSIGPVYSAQSTRTKEIAALYPVRYRGNAFAFPLDSRNCWVISHPGVNRSDVSTWCKFPLRSTIGDSCRIDAGVFTYGIADESRSHVLGIDLMYMDHGRSKQNVVTISGYKSQAAPHYNFSGDGTCVLTWSKTEGTCVFTVKQKGPVTLTVSEENTSILPDAAYRSVVAVPGSAAQRHYSIDGKKLARSTACGIRIGQPDATHRIELGAPAQARKPE